VSAGRASVEDAPRRDSKWWGWGDPAIAPDLDPEAEALLGVELGGLHPASRPRSAEEVELPPPEPVPQSIADLVGPEHVLTAHEDRLRHAAGKGYVDLVRIRSGRLDAAPDAVVLPASPAEVRALLEVCASDGVAVVPFGGGTSVVGGVEPLRGGHGRVISLDLARLREVSVDPRALTARLGAGLRGPEAERALGAAGMTLGHFPQSFEYATVGGFAATRSAGQASSGYGRFDALVTSARLLAPAGEIETLETPHSAAGPALRELIVGSEGAFGVIPDVTVRVRPSPERRRYEAWFTESFEAGAEIVRAMAQDGVLPDVIRVSDQEETRVSLTMSGSGGTARRLLERYLRLRGVTSGSLMIVGVEGGGEAVDRRRALAARKLRAGGAVYVGQGAGRSWERGRYHGPYLRDTLIDAGALAETLETAHTWTRLMELHEATASAIRRALEAQGTPGIVLCHLSHAYPDGASLYFTFIARAREGEEVAQWQAVKRAASEAIVATGATITHHHAVGRDHTPYMEAEVGETGVEALRALKERLDPAGVMNPGKLLPAN
jgi:alkyldihydroxyacetonephosphate synthase